jgi:hypothetical protein
VRKAVKRGRARRVVAATVVAFAAWAALVTGAAALPDGRAYEMVSPPHKNGGDVIAESQRTRAAADGDGVGFTSLRAFGDAQGTGVAVDYLSERSTEPAPGTNGWTTHGITPLQAGMSVRAVLLTALEPLYVGDFSDDLDRGVFFAWSPLTDAPSVKDVVNLYRRTDLRTPGAGQYDLITACPLCDATSTPLAPLPGNALAAPLAPFLADASPDMRHVIFESRQRLTGDTPLQASNRARLYSWDDGTLRLAGRIPIAPAIECDDAGAPVCTAADVSIAGQGAGANHATWLTPHTVSDGSDGHTRTFFTRPTNNGTSLAASGFVGNLYMRVDDTVTAQINASETGPTGFAPAHFLDASVDGSRAFFMTAQALTADAPSDGQGKLYMYDGTKPASAPDNLTFLSADGELGDGSDPANVRGLIGTSDDGSYVYFLAEGQLVSDEPLGTDPNIYLWHDGDISYIGPSPRGTAQIEISVVTSNYIQLHRQARVTPDGRHLLFSAISGAGLTGYDHGSCESGLGVGCRELYVYSADNGDLVCASCNPSGAPATRMATTGVRANQGATRPTWHQNRALSDDGARVFFSTAEALVPEDTNGRIDAYEYDVAAGAVHLLSSGKSPADSWFLDASSDGDDAFFVTREQLVGWDADQAYDLYDARVGGGFPEPARALVPCTGDVCQGLLGTPPGGPAAGSALLTGAGNASGTLKPRAKKCRRGFVKKRVRGKRKCVKRKRHTATRSQRSVVERRGS